MKRIMDEFNYYKVRIINYFMEGNGFVIITKRAIRISVLILITIAILMLIIILKMR